MKLFAEEEKQEETLADKFGNIGKMFDEFLAQIKEFFNSVKEAFEKLFNSNKDED